MANQPSSLSRSVLNVVLVLIESILTLILRFDANLRRAVYPLAKTDTLVCIRTYLPHSEIYATFGYKGILLDSNPPTHKAPDVIINAYSFQLINAIIMHNADHINDLQMRGNDQKIALIKAFLLQIGVARIFNTLINKIKGQKSTTATPQEKQRQKDDKLETLKNELSQKTNEIQSLTTENRKLATQVGELQSRQKSTQIALIVVGLIAIASIIYNIVLVFW